MHTSQLLEKPAFRKQFESVTCSWPMVEWVDSMPNFFSIRGIYLREYNILIFVPFTGEEKQLLLVQENFQILVTANSEIPTHALLPNTFCCTRHKATETRPDHSLTHTNVHQAQATLIGSLTCTDVIKHGWERVLIQLPNTINILV